MNIDIKEILFWIFLIFSMVLLIWRVFGNTPSEFITLTSFIFTVLLKIWSISDRLTKLEISFKYLAKDFKEHIKHNKHSINQSTYIPR